jgi:aminopeptidase N
VISLNSLNPQVAARVARAFDRWRRFDDERRSLAQKQLERIRDTEKLSKDVAEIVGKALAA